MLECIEKEEDIGDEIGRRRWRSSIGIDLLFIGVDPRLVVDVDSATEVVFGVHFVDLRSASPTSALPWSMKRP